MGTFEAVQGGVSRNAASSRHPEEPSLARGLVSGLPGSDAPQGLCIETRAQRPSSRPEGRQPRCLISSGVSFLTGQIGADGLEQLTREGGLQEGQARWEAHGRLPSTVVGPMRTAP